MSSQIALFNLNLYDRKEISEDQFTVFNKDPVKITVPVDIKTASKVLYIANQLLSSSHCLIAVEAITAADLLGETSYPYSFNSITRDALKTLDWTDPFGRLQTSIAAILQRYEGSHSPVKLEESIRSKFPSAKLPTEEEKQSWSDDLHRALPLTSQDLPSFEFNEFGKSSFLAENKSTT